MLKRNCFFLIPLVVVMALVFGVPDGADAKQWPVCPYEANFKIRGPAIVLQMDFVIGDDQEDAILFSALSIKLYHTHGYFDCNAPLLWKTLQ